MSKLESKHREAKRMDRRESASERKPVFQAPSRVLTHTSSAGGRYPHRGGHSSPHTRSPPGPVLQACSSSWVSSYFWPRSTLPQPSQTLSREARESSPHARPVLLSQRSKPSGATSQLLPSAPSDTAASSSWQLLPVGSGGPRRNTTGGNGNSD